MRPLLFSKVLGALHHVSLHVETWFYLKKGIFKTKLSPASKIHATVRTNKFISMKNSFWNTMPIWGLSISFLRKMFKKWWQLSRQLKINKQAMESWCSHRLMMTFIIKILQTHLLLEYTMSCLKVLFRSLYKVQSLFLQRILIISGLQDFWDWVVS